MNAAVIAKSMSVEGEFFVFSPATLGAAGRRMVAERANRANLVCRRNVGAVVVTQPLGRRS